MALGGALGLAWSPVTPVTRRLFAWQEWRNLTSTFVLRGMRGTISHPPSFRVAGVALMALGGAPGLAWSPVTPVTPRHFAWQVWHNLTSTFVLRGRRGTISDPLVSRGRRGTHGTGWRPWTGLVARDARDAAALCVAGVAQSQILWFRVAGVALMALGGALGLAWSPVTPVTPWHFAWQAWRNLTSTIVSRSRRGLCHTPSFTYNFHTQLCQPASFTYLFSHTTLSHTIFHTLFCHTPSLTHHL